MLRGSLLVFLLCGTAAATESPPVVPVVLELFTSEGCSSCPPADSLLAELGASPDVIALELHVDYWDGLGWKDPFSQAAFSDRQARYQGARGVYTPEVVVNGAAEAVGSDRGHIDALRKKAAPARVPVVLTATRVGDALTIQASAPQAPVGTELVVAVAESGLSTDVRRGENAGKHLAHGAVVRRLERVPASGALRVAVDPSWRKLSVVALLSDGKSGQILGVARTTP